MLGIYPAVGLAKARAGRDEAKRNLAANIDPSAWNDARTAYYAGQILRRFGGAPYSAPISESKSDSFIAAIIAMKMILASRAVMAALMGLKPALCASAPASIISSVGYDSLCMVCA